MKKMTLILSSFAMMMLLVVVGCNKDDDPVDDGGDTTEELSVEGSWQVQSVDFVDPESVAWNPNIPYNGGTSLGYAPFMYTIIRGYDFKEAKIDNDSIDGYEFNFMLDREFGDPGVVYWYWDYNADGDGFDVTQLNVPNGPPMNFSIMNAHNVELDEDGEVMVFDAEVYSRKPGGTFDDLDIVPVEITLIKGDVTKVAEVFIGGEPFEEP